MSRHVKLAQAKDGDEFDYLIQQKRKARMENIDKLPEDVRHCIHTYGYTPVYACLDLGIKKGNQIRHLIETILNECSATRGAYSKQGVRTDVEKH